MRALGVNQIDAQGPRRFQSVITVGFATGEIGFRVSFAPQQSQPVHVRFGSLADIALGLSALPPEADISCCLSNVRLVAKAAPYASTVAGNSRRF